MYMSWLRRCFIKKPSDIAYFLNNLKTFGRLFKTMLFMFVQGHIHRKCLFSFSVKMIKVWFLDFRHFGPQPVTSAQVISPKWTLWTPVTSAPKKIRPPCFLLTFYVVCFINIVICHDIYHFPKFVHSIILFYNGSYKLSSKWSNI